MYIECTYIIMYVCVYIYIYIQYVQIRMTTLSLGFTIPWGKTSPPPTFLTGNGI